MKGGRVMEDKAGGEGKGEVRLHLEGRGVGEGGLGRCGWRDAFFPDARLLTFFNYCHIPAS